MYVRPQGYRYAEGVRLPKNYSGNTFREPEPTEEAEVTESPTEPQEKNEPQSTEALLKSEKKSPLSFLGGNGIGSEELLIFAIILLLSDSDLGDDLILFLILLFFIK